MLLYVTWLEVDTEAYDGTASILLRPLAKFQVAKDGKV